MIVHSIYWFTYAIFVYDRPTLIKLYFHFLSNWTGSDRGDSFPFDFEPNRIPFGLKSKIKESPRSYSIQCELKWKYSFLSAPGKSVQKYSAKTKSILEKEREIVPGEHFEGNFASFCKVAISPHDWMATCRVFCLDGKIYDLDLIK